MKRCEVVGVRLEMPTNQPMVILAESDGDRHLPIWIGAAEAAAIAYAHEGVVPPRPLTHDLLLTVVEELGSTLARVEVVTLGDGVYRAELVVDRPRAGEVGQAGEAGDSPADGAGERLRIDARASDAIALALRAQCPILVADSVFDEAGVRVGGGEDEVEKFKEFLDHVSPEDFDLGGGARPT